jgi:hypothetical protein
MPDSSAGKLRRCLFQALFKLRERWHKGGRATWNVYREKCLASRRSLVAGDVDGKARTGRRTVPNNDNLWKKKPRL